MQIGTNAPAITFDRNWKSVTTFFDAASLRAEEEVQ